MAQITEDYVSFEIAKLLKEKGFPQDPHVCNTAYTSKGNLSNNAKSFVHNSETYAKCGVKPLHYSMAPTLQMAMKWLRIEHNIHIEPHIVRTEYSYGYLPYYIDLKKLEPHFPLDEFDFSNADKYVCITYDKACEVAIKYCLENLI